MEQENNYENNYEVVEYATNVEEGKTNTTKALLGGTILGGLIVGGVVAVVNFFKNRKAKKEQENAQLQAKEVEIKQLKEANKESK